MTLELFSSIGKLKAPDYTQKHRGSFHLLQYIMGGIFSHSNFKADQFSAENMPLFKYTTLWNKC